MAAGHEVAARDTVELDRAEPATSDSAGEKDGCMEFDTVVSDDMEDGQRVRPRELGCPPPEINKAWDVQRRRWCVSRASRDGLCGARCRTELSRQSQMRSIPQGGINAQPGAPLVPEQDRKTGETKGHIVNYVSPCSLKHCEFYMALPWQG